MIPRIPLDGMPAALAAMLRPKVERLGYLGEFFQCAANQPEALRSFMQFTDDLRAALPDNLTEIVALTVSAYLSNSYERHQHERLCLKSGFTSDWIHQVLSLSVDSGSAVKPEERAVQQLVLAVLETNGQGAGRELEHVVEVAGARQAIAVLLLIGRYMTHAVLVNTLGLAPPVSSPLEP